MQNSYIVIFTGKNGKRNTVEYDSRQDAEVEMRKLAANGCKILQHYPYKPGTLMPHLLTSKTKA